MSASPTYKQPANYSVTSMPPKPAVKKVLILSSLYKPHVGGVQTVVEQLCQQYRRQGIATVVLTKRFPTSQRYRATFHHTPVFRFDRPKSFAEVAGAVQTILRNEKELRPDVVHLLGVRRPMPVIAYLLSRHWQVPYVATIVGGDIPDTGDPDSIRLWNEAGGTVEPYVTRADAITVFSQATQDLAKQVLHTNRPITMIYAGVDIQRIQRAIPVAGPNNFFFTARRLDYSKGLDILITAFSIVTKTDPKVKLVIAGDGEEQAALEQQCVDLRIKSRVIFLGRIPLDAVYGYMKTAIAHLCPSRAESGGLVNIEAQAAGCLAVGSRVGGIGEYIADGVTGLLHEPDSVDALVKTLQYLLAPENQVAITQIKKQATASINTFTWTHCAEQYVHLYEQLL